MFIEEDVKLDFCDVLIKPKRSTLKSRKDVSLERAMHYKWSDVHDVVIPIWAANMDTTGTFEMAKAFQMGMCNGVWSEQAMPFVALHKHHNIEDWDSTVYYPESLESRMYEADFPSGTNNMAYTCGMNKNEVEKMKTVMDKHHHNGLRYICLDVANGYHQDFLDFVRDIRKWAGSRFVIVAGNVVTREMTEALILAGADVVKVGIGPGSVCTTRKVAGVGYPQLSAIMECADAAHGLGGHVMADGGCTCPGDVAKAFGAGADFVMLGGMLAGHDESGGDVIEENGVPYKRFYGMSSDTAMEKHNGGVATYRASEGKTVTVPYRGQVLDTLKEVFGGIRSACTYVGANNIKNLPKCTTFVRVNRQLNNVFGS